MADVVGHQNRRFEPSVKLFSAYAADAPSARLARIAAGNRSSIRAAPITSRLFCWTLRNLTATTTSFDV